MEKGLTKAQIISELTKSVHAGGASKRKKGEKLPKLTPQQKQDALIGKFKLFLPVGLAAVKEDEHFFTRIVAWNHHKGQVRDSKVALPVIGLHAKDPELLESNLAHLADLRPKEFVRAIKFATSLGVRRNVVRRLVNRWFEDLFKTQGWERTVQLHQKTLFRLAQRYHVKVPKEDATGQALFWRKGTRFEALRVLKMLPEEALSGQIRGWKFDFLLVDGALGERMKEPGTLAAVIEAMTPTQLVTNMKRLQGLGVKDHAITRAALEDALGKAATAKGAAKTTLKATKAAEALTDIDEQLSGKLKQLQEKQLDVQKGIEGDWLVLGDMSPSMEEGVEKAVEVAAVLARLVRGKIYLVFFNDAPTSFDVTGKSLDEIKTMTRFIRASGQGTRAKVGLEWLSMRKLTVDGIAIVGDGGENVHNEFAQAFKKFEESSGCSPTLYFYKLKPGAGYANQVDTLSPQMSDMTVFDLRGGVDYYSLPNVVQTMRVGKWSLVDEVMNTPLRTLDEVLDKTIGVKVLAERDAVHA